MANQLTKTLAFLEKFPRFYRGRILNKVLGRRVKFIGTAGVKCELLTPTKSVFTLKNRKKVQNHIGGVHAAATSLLAETATGMVFGMSVPDDKIPLIKTMHIDYVKRAKGDLRAEASMTLEQIERVKTEEKGDIEVKVIVTDEEGKEPVECKMVWAWTPKRRN